MDENQIECTNIQKPKLSLWVVSYKIPVGATCKGLAVVSAFDAKEARQTFLANSAFNGQSSKIVIEEMYQVGESVVPMLLAEQYFEDPYV